MGETVPQGYVVTQPSIDILPPKIRLGPILGTLVQF